MTQTYLSCYSHFVFHGDITGHIMMISPIRGRTVIDINASVDNNRAIMGHLLAAHGLTGCDTVAIYHGIGKGKALKVLRLNTHSLSKVGDITTSLLDVLRQATPFMLSCYGHPECDSMTAARHRRCGPQKYHAILLLPQSFKAFHQQMRHSEKM